ncbi:hypothetical protein LGL55_24135 [Clostridium tagluense]|uniref:hypothetical protein n=1 Tax=Clostridium tagluense TaxID=360422 RepID=UPI001CF25CA6|nr:hypothetical protein [Clostridium tagluense]MCB2314150.1 hypothetical protein [Clostridium tagluense]MCB2318939.1 hypothetical protein [Clostridium tagluense]MCB2323869.1 hypothetical protein [Clostridium tagluense]MCB2328708.1 hypothetical protein [Clostridium tagluense]MCB2333593.1 hypothetical protein [Clostridium tagluense]
MKSSKSISMIGVMLLVGMLSKPVMAVGVKSFDDIPNFSIVIGDSMFTVDYANDSKNANQISDALIKNKGDIFIKTNDSGWVKNSDGKQVNKDLVDVSTIKFNNNKEIGSTVIKPGKDTSGISVTAKVHKIQFASTITKTGINTATFKYKVLDENGTDITKTVPLSEISVFTSLSSSVSVDPLTGIGTITFNSSSDTDKLYVVTLIDKIGGVMATICSNDLEVVNNNDTKDLHVICIDTHKLTKTGSNTATFKYKILNKSDIDITKTIPASKISASGSVNSTIALDPSTATGTITYNSSTDVDKEIKISLVDKVTGLTVSSTMSTSEIVVSEPITKGTKVSKITITSTQLAIANGYGYAAYSVYDEDGKDITSSSLSDTITFNSQFGTIVAKRGMLKLTPNAGISLNTLNSVMITGNDSITGVSMSAKLIIIVPIVLQ